MAGVSFGAHRLALLAAYQEVIGEDSPTDWALYTYEDDSDDLKLAASGGGGLQELSGHFENQKVMYGFCSVKGLQAALPKYVLVNWVGEDVADARKCACASHVAKVAEFFQGVDVIVNASSVEDVDPGAIGQRLSNGLARIASPVLHRLRLREDENAEPVGTTYQKTDAAVEMKRLNREQFWEQAKKEEELRKEEERQKVLEERLRFEQERMEQERLEQEERERRYREREEQIEEHRRKQQTLEAEEARQRLQEQSIFGEPQPEEEGQQLKKLESEVEEAAAIIAQRPDNPREFFKQQERVASGGSDTTSPFSPRPDSPGPSSEGPAVLTADTHWAFEEPPGSLAWQGADWTAAQEGGPGPTEDLVFLEPKEPLLLPVAALPADAESLAPTQPPGPNPESLIDLWQNDSSAPAPPAAWELVAPVPGPPLPILVEVEVPPASPAAPASAPPAANLLNFDELPEPPATFCDAEQDAEPASSIAMEGPHQPTLSYQHALQEAAGGQQPPPAAQLLTNGEMAQKEGMQASEGYFSQSQDEEFGPVEEPAAKTPPAVFYTKPPEIDITCWDADPVPEDEESFGGSV
ncbi:drebrin isoform X3 [Emydura macquarii macquarii]|uniref:drebrin isoform X3 n=1 Tax=Emydura macquarii macquarii TaxID=1129001 RepID=UPI00352A8CF4